MMISKYQAAAMITIILALLLVGCGMPLTPPTPCATLSEGWKWDYPEPEGLYCESDIDAWWEVFDDPLLDLLEEEALSYNQDLQQAFERLCEARARSVSACAGLWPQVLLNPSYYNIDSLQENPVPLPAGLPVAIPSMFRFHNVQNMMPLNISYEADLWQKMSHTCRAGCQRAEAAQEDWYATRLVLTTDVAQNYYLLRALDTERQLLENTLKLRQQGYDLNRSRYQEGVSTYLDVSASEALLWQAQSDLEDTIRRRALQENALALLCGAPASDFSLPLLPLEGSPPGITPDLPSEVLCRRPDIAALEHQMEAFYNDAGVAYASLFPSLSLTGRVGFQSPELFNWFSWQGRLWSLAVDASQTIFDAGYNQANLAYAKARYRESLAAYREQVLAAFLEVENALANAKQHTRSLEALEKQVAAAQITATLTEQRHIEGLVTILDVVEAQKTLLDAQSQEVQARGQRFVDAVQLVKALGGGW